MAHFVIAAIISVAGLAVAVKRRAFDRPSPLWFYVPVTVGLFGSAYISRLHSGGYDNVLQPAHAAVAIGFGLGLHALVRVDPPRPGRPALPAWRRWVPATACVAGLLQFGLLTYNPAKQIPDSRNAARTRHLVAALRDLPGTVFMPGHGWYLSLAGKQTSAPGSSHLRHLPRQDQVRPPRPRPRACGGPSPSSASMRSSSTRFPGTRTCRATSAATTGPIIGSSGATTSCCPRPAPSPGRSRCGCREIADAPRCRSTVTSPQPVPPVHPPHQ